MPGPPTIDGVDAPLLPIWSAAQPVLVLPPSSRPGHTIAPPTPPIPPRGPQPEPPETTMGAGGTDAIEEPVPPKTAKAK
jgi:hypothetical protein